MLVWAFRGIDYILILYVYFGLVVLPSSNISSIQLANSVLGYRCKDIYND
jgi:hypothetical protein